jgi:hypothetical protein
VDTPERGEPCHDEATQKLRELAGDSVRVERGHGGGYLWAHFPLRLHSGWREHR